MKAVVGLFRDTASPSEYRVPKEGDDEEKLLFFRNVGAGMYGR